MFFLLLCVPTYLDTSTHCVTPNFRCAYLFLVWLQRAQDASRTVEAHLIQQTVVIFSAQCLPALSHSPVVSEQDKSLKRARSPSPKKVTDKFKHTTRHRPFCMRFAAYVACLLALFSVAPSLFVPAQRDSCHTTHSTLRSFSSASFLRSSVACEEVGPLSQEGRCVPQG